MKKVFYRQRLPDIAYFDDQYDQANRDFHVKDICKGLQSNNYLRPTMQNSWLKVHMWPLITIDMVTRVSPLLIVFDHIAESPRC